MTSAHIANPEIVTRMNAAGHKEDTLWLRCTAVRLSSIQEESKTRLSRGQLQYESKCPQSLGEYTRSRPSTPPLHPAACFWAPREGCCLSGHRIPALGAGEEHQPLRRKTGPQRPTGHGPCMPSAVSNPFIREQELNFGLGNNW